MDISPHSDDQVASQDEYEIALAESVDDDAVLDESGPTNFTIASYGADYTVDSLVKRMKAEAFTVPDFQRRFVWSQKHASRFVESLLMGLPVPGIFLYRQSGTNKHLVIDGQQRLRTLQAFYVGIFSEKRFRLTGVRKQWEGLTYVELPPADQLKLDDSIVHATIFTQEKPADVLDSIFFVFERINSGGVRLSPQEIRNCILPGPFIELVKRLNQDVHWRSIFGSDNRRAKDEELIIRFLAMLLDRPSYSRPMARFLNKFSQKMNVESAGKFGMMEETFCRTTKVVWNALGPRAFRPVRSLNAAVYDSAMVGIATRLRLREGPGPDNHDVAAAYDSLLEQPEYKRAWERATADEESVKARMDAAIKAFDVI